MNLPINPSSTFYPTISENNKTISKRVLKIFSSDTYTESCGYNSEITLPNRVLMITGAMFN